MPSARIQVASTRTCRANSGPRHARRSGRRSDRCTSASSPGALVAQRMLRVVEPGSREPFGARHFAAAEHAGWRRRELHAAELDQRLPERRQVAHRPAPQRFVVLELVAALLEPGQVSGEMRSRESLRGGFPEQCAFLDLGHAGTVWFGQESIAGSAAGGSGIAPVRPRSTRPRGNNKCPRNQILARTGGRPPKAQSH